MKNLKQIIFLFLLVMGFASAQVGIGTMTPDPNSDLTLASTNKGLLLNRVALTSTTDAVTAGAHTAGMFVYNTATNASVTPGLYYNDGTKWGRVQLNNSPIPSLNWLLGDTTIDGTSFIGTTAASTNKNFSIRTNSAEVIRIDPSQNVGIRTATPGNKLEVATGFPGVSGVRLQNSPSVVSLGTNGNGDVIASATASFINGSMKYSYQAGDHNGWIKLDGRATNTFGVNQQTVLFNILALSGAAPIPNATDKYLSQVSAGALGSVSGNTGNAVTLTQANLPDVQLGGTTGLPTGAGIDGAGNHTHTFERSVQSLNVNAGGQGVFNISNLTSRDTSSSGAHTHTIATNYLNTNTLVNTPSTSVNITPETIKLNVFLYVGL
jgi:hypothetical protein